MICPNCGFENNDSAKFCKKCGTSLKEVPNINEENIQINENKKSNSKNLIIICITVIICSILIAGCIIFININNDTTVNSNNPNYDPTDSSSNNDSSDNNTSDTNPTTINSDVYTYNVQGVDFNVPSSGHMRTSEALSFEYNGETCEVQEVPQYEASTYNHELSSVTFSKNYQNGEPYQLIVNNHPWIGVKVEKGGKWFHISMNINDVNEAEKLVDWMSQHNTWNAP